MINYLSGINPHHCGCQMCLISTRPIKSEGSQSSRTGSRAQVIDTAAGFQVTAVRPPGQQGTTESLEDTRCLHVACQLALALAFAER